AHISLPQPGDGKVSAPPPEKKIIFFCSDPGRPRMGGISFWAGEDVLRTERTSPPHGSLHCRTVLFIACATSLAQSSLAHGGNAGLKHVAPIAPAAAPASK